MCLHRYTKYSCGHCYEKDPLAGGYQTCTKCPAATIALHYYHDQPLFESTESYLGHTIPCPKPCRKVFPDQVSTSPETRAEWARCEREFQRRLRVCGIDQAVMDSIYARVTAQGLDSHRKVKKDVPPASLPRGFLPFFEEFERYQALEEREVNVITEPEARGCGYPSSTPDVCLAGWNAKDILMYRYFQWNWGVLSLWGVPPAATYDGLVIKYGENPAYPTPEDVRKLVPLKMTEALKDVLTRLPLGPLMDPASSTINDRS